MTGFAARNWSNAALGAAALAVVCCAGAASAQEGWSARVVLTEPAFDLENAKLVPADYKALAGSASSKKWFVCVLEPHTGSEYWVGYTYGAFEEAKRQNIKLRVLSAGGYSNIAGQIGQFEDCVTQGANAIGLVTTSP